MTLRGVQSALSGRVRTLPERHGGIVALIALALIVLLGTGLRLDHALNPSADPGGKGTIVAYQGNDSKAYGQIAANLYRTGRYGTPQMLHPADWSPVAPFLYATVYKVTGGVSEETGRAVVAVLGGLMVLLVYLLGRRLGGPFAGLLAAFFAAIYPTFLDNSEQILSEPIAAFTLTAAVLGFLWASDPGRSLWAWLVPGAFLGATALARPEYLPFVAVLGVVALIRVGSRRGYRIGFASAALFVVAFCAVLAPWAVRNYLVLDKFVPVTTGGGKALFVATYLPGDGRQLQVKRALIEKFTGKPPTVQQVADTEMKNLLDRVAHKYPDMERDAALARIGRENFRKYFGEQPGAYMQMVATKLWNVWRRGSGPTMRGSGWIVFHYTLLALAITGLALLAFRRRYEVIPLGLLIGGITLLGGVLLAVPRRNVPLMPLVFALAAAGAVWLALVVGGWITERTRNRRTPSASLS
jgi:hypothetical protein